MYTDFVSDEPLSIIRANECESQMQSLCTMRFRAVFNALEREPSLRDIANTINVARYQTPDGLPAKEVEEEDRQGREYSYRLARAVRELYRRTVSAQKQPISTETNVNETATDGA